MMFFEVVLTVYFPSWKFDLIECCDVTLKNYKLRFIFPNVCECYLGFTKFVAFLCLFNLYDFYIFSGVPVDVCFHHLLNTSALLTIMF